MDAGAFVQENKPWLVGCTIGLIVWWISASVIDSVYYHPVQGTPRGALKEAYKQDALDMAYEEGEQLTAELGRLKQELSFVVAPTYSQWTGPADQHLYLKGRDLKRAVMDAASYRDINVEVKNLVWEPATGIDQIRGVLYGLDMINEIQARLFASHDKTKAHDEDAMGLSEIDSVKLESVRNNRNRSRSRSRRGGIDLADYVTQQTVSVQFQSDEPTAAAFLESCRVANRTLVLDRLQVLEAPRPGEPITVQATLSGISFVEKAE